MTKQKQQEEWLTSKQAAAILTANSGHAVSDAYVRLLGSQEKLTWKQLDARTKLYLRSDVEKYRVIQRGVKVINPSRVMMQCQVCGQQWSPNLGKGGRLPANAMLCPNGCTLDVEQVKEENAVA